MVLLLLPALLRAQGQQGSGSPYSAYGLGEFTGSPQIAQAMMGGLGVAVVDPYSTVSLNPASYAFLQRPVFETGLVVRSSQYANAVRTNNGRRTDITGLSMGVPFGKGRWGIALGVNPQSQVGYELTDTKPLPGGEGNVVYRYTGEGGLNQAYIGAGFVVAQKRDTLSNGYRFSVGANLGYLFGSIEEHRKTGYPAQQGFYNTSVFSSLIIRDPTGTLGAQYQGVLRKRKSRSDGGLHFLAGVSVELPAELSARRTDVVNSFAFSSSGVEVPVDTAYFANAARGTLGLPAGYGVGFTVFDQNWTISAEVRQRDWTRLKLNVADYTAPGELASSSSFILGVGFRPAKDAGGSFWQRTTYRAGARYTNDYLVVGGHQLEQKALSMGLSLPIMASTTRSRIHFGTELGERGTVKEGLLRERYAMLFVGLTISPDVRENWFKKRAIE